MNLKQKARNALHAVLALLLGVGGGAVAVAFDFGGAVETLTLSGFRSRGLRENGEPDWELSSATATIRGILAELEDIELLFHSADGYTVTIRSPRCLFNQTTKTGQSDAPLQVRSHALELDGIGYDVLAGDRRLRVRSQVRMKLRQRLAHLDTLRSGSGGSAGPEPAAPTATGGQPQPMEETP